MTMSNYHGIPVLDLECEALTDLEIKLGKAIPFSKNVLWGSFGFSMQAKHITKLGLYGLGLKTLPRSFGNFAFLRYLYLDANKLSSLPQSFGRLTKLRELGLSGNKFKALPKSVGKLADLGHINLKANELTCLPESIGNLKRLKSMSLLCNNLSSLPDSIGQLNLRYLSLYMNNLKSLPDTLLNIKTLKSLEIDEDLMNDPVADELSIKQKVKIKTDLFDWDYLN